MLDFAAGLFGLTAAVGIRYRPIPDFPIVQKTSIAVSKYRTMNLCEEPLILLASRSLTMLAGSVGSKFLMNVMNSIDIVENIHYEDFLNCMRRRSQDTPLITVANHETCLDDPGLMGGIVPIDVIADPKKMRWGICEQGICFGKNPLQQGFAGLGQALPVWRGGGIDQPLLLDVARRVANGDWVHVFPEGRVLQSGRLALDEITSRDQEQLAAKGRLKWGVGKLIAHAPVQPIVLPWHHFGMAPILPQNAAWLEDEAGGRRFDNSLKSWWPRSGHRVRVEFGARVEFADLIRHHEQKHGRLRKVSSGARGWADAIPWWRESTVAERLLYSSITRRVEAALLDLESRTPGRPDFGVRGLGGGGCGRA